MANPMTILVTVGAVLFGAYYFFGMGCRGEGDENGLTGKEGALCFDKSMLGFGNGEEDAGDAAEVDSTPLSTEGGMEIEYAPGSRPGSITPARRTGTPASRAKSTGGGVGGPSSNLAYAYAGQLKDQITIA